MFMLCYCHVGAAPHRLASLSRLAILQTGVTIMKMDQGVDTGVIIHQHAIKIEDDDTAGSLSEKLSHLGADFRQSENPARDIYQANSSRSRRMKAKRRTPQRYKEYGLLDFAKPVEVICSKRARLSSVAGRVLRVERRNVKSSSSPTPRRAMHQRGQRLIIRGQPAVGARGGLLILDEVQPAGKKFMSGKAFLSGARAWVD